MNDTPSNHTQTHNANVGASHKLQCRCQLQARTIFCSPFTRIHTIYSKSLYGAITENNDDTILSTLGNKISGSLASF